jgi:hypothetical protein
MAQPRNTKSRGWCFTLNNYTDQDIADFKASFADSKDFVVGKEVGTNGTPHLQGVIRFEKARTYNNMKKLLPRAHIEMMKKYNASVIYCKKEGDYFEKNSTELITHETEYNDYMKNKYDNINWHPWQGDILALLETAADERRVFWYWEINGNCGKSFLTKYIDWKYNAIIANGKQSDVFNQYKNYLDDTKRQPKVAIIDIPRSHKDYVCYSTLEKIKDGLLYSGKYEGGKIRLVPHHLIIFANFEPDISKLSEDRWVINNI